MSAPAEPRVLDEWTSHDGDDLRIVEADGAHRLQFYRGARGWYDAPPREHAYALFNRLCERADPEPVQEKGDR